MMRVVRVVGFSNSARAEPEAGPGSRARHRGPIPWRPCRRRPLESGIEAALIGTQAGSGAQGPQSLIRGRVESKNIF